MTCRFIAEFYSQTVLLLSGLVSICSIQYCAVQLPEVNWRQCVVLIRFLDLLMKVKRLKEKEKNPQ